MARRNRPQTDSALLEPSEAITPARVAQASDVADRDERARLLTAILRDDKASGAEVVAAARLLEAMERTDASQSGRGIPPPTSRPEQVQRIVRILTAAGPVMQFEALEIIATRYEKSRTAYLQRRKDGQTMTMAQVDAFQKRIRPARKKMWEERSGVREDQRSEHESSGTAAAESEGLRELPEVAESVGPTADEDERVGDGTVGAGDGTESADGEGGES